MIRLRFGMVGGAGDAFIGDSHRRGAQMDNLAHLTSGCFSRNMQKNHLAAEKWHVNPSRLYKDYRQMAEQESIREDGIDFVIIVTPNNTHYEIAKCFLEHGIHVSCDKPVSIHLEQALELQQLAKERGLHFGVSYTYVNYPLVHQMRAMIDNGEIGSILTVMAEYPQDWVINSIKRGDFVFGAWRFDRKIAGNSASTADIGSHLECLIHRGTGLKVEQVLANLTPIPSDLPLETNTQLLLKLSGGVPAMLWASQVAIGHECSVSLRVFGNKGALEWCHDNPNRLKFTKANGTEMWLTSARDFLADGPKSMSRIAAGHPEGFFEAFGNYYRGFCQELQRIKGITDAMPLSHPTIEDGIRGISFVDACIESQKRGNTWVAIK